MQVPPLVLYLTPYHRPNDTSDMDVGGDSGDEDSETREAPPYTIQLLEWVTILMMMVLTLVTQ